MEFNSGFKGLTAFWEPEVSFVLNKRLRQ